MMKAIAKENNIEFSRIGLSLYQDNSQFSYFGSNGAFYLSRKFEVKNDVKAVYHDYFKVPEKLQGSGISKRVFQELYTQYKNAKIKQIDVYANLDVGGYTWSKYGFSCTSKNDLDIIKLRAKNYFASGKLSEVEFNDFNGLTKKYNRNKNFPMYKVGYTTYGKKLLLDANWHGTIDLNSRLQKKVFETYLNRS